MLKRWCDTDVPEKRDKAGVVLSPRIWCRMQIMELKPVTIKNVPNILAYVCPNCNTPRWLPGESVMPFLDGLNK